MRPSFVVFLLANALTSTAQQQAAGPGPAANTNPTAATRAEQLSNQMVRELHLNGYQASRLRAINGDKAAQLAAAERQLAGRPTQLDQQRQAIARDRDQELQAVLSTDQYTDYFDARTRYAQLDRDYARTASGALLVDAVRNPAPVRDNDAVISPAKTGKEARPPVPLGRTLRQ